MEIMQIREFPYLLAYLLHVLVIFLVEFTDETRGKGLHGVSYLNVLTHMYM